MEALTQSDAPAGKEGSGIADKATRRVGGTGRGGDGSAAGPPSAVAVRQQEKKGRGLRQGDAPDRGHGEGRGRRCGWAAVCRRRSPGDTERERERAVRSIRLQSPTLLSLRRGEGRSGGWRRDRAGTVGGRRRDVEWGLGRLRGDGRPPAARCGDEKDDGVARLRGSRRGVGRRPAAGGDAAWDGEDRTGRESDFRFGSAALYVGYILNGLL